MEADKDGDGKLDFEEFSLMVSNTVSATQLANRIFKHTMLIQYCQDIVKQMTLENLF